MPSGLQTNVFSQNRSEIFEVEGYDIHTDKMIKSRRMATRSGAVRMGCVVIEGTGKIVDSNLVGLEGWTAIDFVTEE